jgi:hypothetical protein
MTKEEFKSKIKTAADNTRRDYPELRKGQAIFIQADKHEHIARIVQFDYGIDCFYDDTMIEPFLDKCWEIYSKTFINDVQDN